MVDLFMVNNIVFEDRDYASPRHGGRAVGGLAVMERWRGSWRRGSEVWKRDLTGFMVADGRHLPRKYKT
jgi:hypothetical protein